MQFANVPHHRPLFCFRDWRACLRLRLATALAANLRSFRVVRRSDGAGGGAAVLVAVSIGGTVSMFIV
jgi:hypothetical protein